MALITGYASLLTSVATYIARSDLTVDIPGFVQNWEERFYRQPMNFGRWMETSLSSTIASSVIAVPSDYLVLKYSYINGSPSSRLDRLSLNQLYGKFPRGGQTGMPLYIARDTTNFVFGPAPDSAYTVKGVYWAKPALIRNFASDAAGHYIITDAPDLVLYGALLEAQPFLMNDKRIQTWDAMYARALDEYRALFKLEENSGSPVQEVLA